MYTGLKKLSSFTIIQRIFVCTLFGFEIGFEFNGNKMSEKLANTKFGHKQIQN